MKYLNEYKIFEEAGINNNTYTKRNDFPIDDNNIEFLCQKYSISDYFYEYYDGVINCRDGVDISYYHIKRLPLRFGQVIGIFNCSNNGLESLSGSPSEVSTDFYCSNNDLSSLEGGPDKVGRNFVCCENNLTSLSGSPSHTGGTFYCTDNNILSLEGIGDVVGSIFCSGNPIYFIVKWFIRKHNKNELIELFNDTDIIQGDKIIYDRLVWFFEEIGVDLPNLDKDIISKNYKIIR